MSDIEQAIAEAQAQAQAAVAQAETLHEQGVTPAEVAEAYGSDTDTEGSTEGAASASGYGEAQGQGGASQGEVDQHYADQYAEPPVVDVQPVMDEDAMWDYAVRQGLGYVPGQVVSYIAGKVIGGIWSIVFELESDQPKTGDTKFTLYGYQAYCDGVHEGAGERWVGPTQKTEALAKQDLETHERAGVHLDTMSHEGQGGGYQ